MAEFVVEFGKDGRRGELDGRLDAAAFHRNDAPIRAVLARLLAGRQGDVLEAGSGTGQHITALAREHPSIVWWPSDLNDRHLESIAAWRAHAALPNLRSPQRIDLADPAWSIAPVDGPAPGPLLAMFCANVVHIAPWRVAEGLLTGAGRLLRQDGMLVLYGPFKQGGQHTALSNAVFDTSLRDANPEWGVRDVTDLERVAGGAGLALSEIVEMPANNLILVFARAKPA
ncbi:SAM-dependent methyltransferase [Rhodopseudomonas palustris]|uniref:SAM-dependent methyltransferase n=1 Tax=Rhodopseudomonas palustris TaxID=1076 RepID=A0A323USR8_RHOPL|nr:DUF938 domain-containing protein [Rhodopseudomonas palustris]PZA10578.1 SAM-dependent methyltransferase [Rhodopseudomonas palustris]